MFIPANFITPVTDPIERQRIASGRPASRVEILERHQRDHYNDAHVTMPAPRNASHTTPVSMASIRRAISRALINAGERVGPEAA